MHNRLWRFLVHSVAGFVAGTPWSPLLLYPDQSTIDRSSPSLRNPGRPPARRRRRGRRSSQPGIAEECEAFLAGRYHELLLREHLEIPGWAWVNPLAHADCAELERLANQVPRRHHPLALSYLADEVLLRARHDARTLEQIQRETLMHLEGILLHQSGPIELADLATTIARQLERRLPPPARPEGRA